MMVLTHLNAQNYIDLYEIKRTIVKENRITALKDYFVAIFRIKISV